MVARVSPFRTVNLEAPCPNFFSRLEIIPLGPATGHNEGLLPLQKKIHRNRSSTTRCSAGIIKRRPKSYGPSPSDLFLMSRSATGLSNGQRPKISSKNIKLAVYCYNFTVRIPNGLGIILKTKS